MRGFKLICLGFITFIGFNVAAQTRAQSDVKPPVSTDKNLPHSIDASPIPDQISQDALTQTQFIQPKSAPHSTKDKRLDKVHQKIKSDYPSLRHVSRGGLQTWLAQDDPSIVVLDTRPLSEYKVSHIQGAIQIDPDSQARKLSAVPLDGKTVIVYCSVGRRSSNFATRLERDLAKAGARTVLNLEGGVFGWHNDGRKLVNANGQTDMIHPYNGFWGSRYLADKNKITYSVK